MLSVSGVVVSGFYVYVLQILTMMQFMLPSESGEKVTLGLTVLLAYSVFSFNIAESMPETSEVIPLIGIYCKVGKLQGVSKKPEFGLIFEA
jgi:hypothetical protein